MERVAAPKQTRIVFFMFLGVWQVAQHWLCQFPNDANGEAELFPLLANEKPLDPRLKLLCGRQDFLEIGQILGAVLGALGEDFGVADDGIEGG